MTNKKFKKAAMALALTACVAATPLAANAETPENAADVQAPAAVDHTEADTQEAPEAELPAEEEPEAQPAAEAAAQPAAPEATPIAVELPTAEETPEDEEAPEEKEETPVEVTPTEDAVVEKETPAKADVDNLIEDPDADIATMDGAEKVVSDEYEAKIGETSYGTLDKALENAKDDDEVVLQKDHTGNITIAKWIKLNLNKHKIEGNVDVDLSEKQGDAATTQDGEAAAEKKVEIVDGTITGAKDSGVTIKNAEDTNVLLKDLTIENNEGKQGGGVHIENSQNVTIDHCTIQNNSTTEVSKNGSDVSVGAGGGVFVSDNSHVTIQNGSTIQGNTGTRGGGIFLDNMNNPAVLELVNASVDNNTANIAGGIGNYGSIVVLKDGAVLENNTAKQYGGGLYNKGEATVESGAKLYNNHAALAGDDIYLAGKNSTLTLTKVGDDWMLDDCGHKINGWFADLLDARWDADGKQEHVINLKDYKADGLTIVENEDGSYTITILDENTTLALKAAHNVTPKPTPDPDPEPTPDPDTPDTPVSPEDPTTPPVQDATPDEAETPVNPENPSNPPVQDATPDSTVAALPKTGVNWFTALAMALSGMALTVAGAFTSLFAKSKH